MTNVQLYFAIAVPTFTVIVGIMIGLYQSNHVLNQLNLRFSSLENRFGSIENRFTSLEARFESRMAVLESDMKTLVRVTNDLDVRLARVEERLAH